MELYKKYILLKENTEEINDFIKEIEKTIKKYFPNSYLKIIYSTSRVKDIWIDFAIGQKNDWAHGYADNSPIQIKAFIYGINKNNFMETLEFKPFASKMFIAPENPRYTAYNSIKIPARKTTGDKDKIIKSIDKLFSTIKKMTKENLNNFKEEHVWIKNYI